MPDSPFTPTSVQIPDNWQFLNLKQILEDPTPKEPPWCVRGLVAQNCGTEVSAHPHGLKSYSWLQGSIEAPLGRPVWGHFKVQNVKRALFLETEDPRWLLEERVKLLANGLKIKVSDLPDIGCFVLGALGPFNLVQMEKQLKAVIEKYDPDFTVLSTLQGLLGGRNWSSQEEMADVNALLVRVSASHSPLVVITHSPWDKKQRRAAGTITQAANFPTLCHYQKGTDRQGCQFASVVIDSKLGWAEDNRFKLRLLSSPDSIRFEFAKDATRAEIEEYIESHPGETAAKVASALGCSDRWVRKIVKEME